MAEDRSKEKSYIDSAIFFHPTPQSAKELLVRGNTIPSKSVKDMGNDIKIERDGWLVAVDAPIRVVDSVEVHLRWWLREDDVAVDVGYGRGSSAHDQWV